MAHIFEWFQHLISLLINMVNSLRCVSPPQLILGQTARIFILLSHLWVQNPLYHLLASENSSGTLIKCLCIAFFQLPYDHLYVVVLVNIYVEYKLGSCILRMEM